MYFKGKKKTKWYLSYYSTVENSIARNLFRQVSWWIKNIWKHCPFVSKNSPSKTSVSRSRRLLTFAWQLETRNCSISRAVFGKTQDSRSESPEFIFARLLFIPNIKSMQDGRRYEDTEDIKIKIRMKLLELHLNVPKTLFQEFYELSWKWVTSQDYYFEGY